MLNKPVICRILIIVIALILALVELYSRILVFNENTIRGKAYCKLLWEVRDKVENDFLEQPYLGYSNAPGLKGEKAINSIGLVRTSHIPIHKNHNVYRILFLGGPSTYGMAVSKAEQTYPLIIEGLLNDKIDSLSGGKYKSIECLNAGLSGATSAELLTHYLFKFKYLNPDIIVVHAGFNDAYTYLCKNYGVQYQPDYHTAKRVYKNISPVKSPFKYLLFSKALAWVYIRTRDDFKNYLNGTPPYNSFYQFSNHALWFTPGNDSIFSENYNAYYNNLSNLITIAQSHNQKVILVPEIYKKYDPLFGEGNEDLLIQGINQNTEFARKLAQREMVYMCELEKETFTNNMYSEGEDRYLNEIGEKNKAEQVLSCIISIIGGK